MVLQDFTAPLTLAHFDIVSTASPPPIEVTGSFTAREDSPWFDPAGTITLADDRALADYTATTTASYGTLTINDDGTWGYVLDNEHADVEALDGDDDDTDGAVGSLIDTVTITLTSGDETLTHSFDITIDGLTDYYLATNERTLDYSALSEDVSLHDTTGWGPNTLTGGSGNDVLHAYTVTAYLHGGAGDDWFIIGGQNVYNHLYGGAGNDVYTDPGQIWNNNVYLQSTGNIDVDMSASEKWKYNKATDSWVSGTGDGYEYVRAWIDTDNDGLLEADDEFDFIHQNFESITGGTGNDNIITGAGLGIIHGLGGDDRLEITDRGTIYGGAGDDVLIAGSGTTTLYGGEGSDIFDGSAGNTTYGWSHSFRSGDAALHLDMNDETKWKQDAQGAWTSGTSDDFTYVRAWIDLDNDGEATQTDEYDYLLDIDKLSIGATSANDEISGGDGRDRLYGVGGNDVLGGGAGNDWLYGGIGNDVLTGGAGVDFLFGGENNDIFVLNLNGGERDWDSVRDFSSGTVSGSDGYNGTTNGGDDKIRVDIGDSTATTLAALKSAANIRWTNDTTRSGHLNDPNVSDTIIYATHGTVDTSDDTVLMVLDDYAEDLTLAHFDIVSAPPPVTPVASVIDVTGSFTAREDSPWFNPTGTIVFTDGRDDYIATATASYGTVTINDDGTWGYVLDNTNPVVNALDGDDDDTDGALGSLIDTVTITVTDGTKIFTHSFDITIDGLTDYTPADGRTLDYRASSDDLSLHGSYLYGGIGDDVLHGARYSRLFGGDGDDWLIAGVKNNQLIGGSGNDVYMNPSEYHNIYLSSEGDITVDMGASEKWKYDKATEAWVSGTGTEYEYIRAWFDTDDNGERDHDDEYDFIHQGFRKVAGGDDNDDITSGSALSTIAGNDGNDRLEITRSGTIFGGDGDDTLIAGSGSTKLYGGLGNDIFDGSAGHAIYVWEYSHTVEYRAEGIALHLDMNDETKWKQDAQGVWTSGTSEDFTHVRAWFDRDNDGEATQADEFDYLLDINSLDIHAPLGSNRISGSDGNDVIRGGNVDDIIYGNGGNDGIYTGDGDDLIDGGAGSDNIQGGEDNDIFVLNLGGGVNNLDIVRDFSFGTVSGHSYYSGKTIGGDDKIRVDIGDSTVTTLEELKSAVNIRWTNDTTRSGTLNDRNINDTIIYATQGTVDTTDDIILMVLDDYAEDLTLAQFDIV